LVENRELNFARPGNPADTVEADQAVERPQPQIAIPSLGHRDDGALGQAIGGSPNFVDRVMNS
jgi:hypothetical protein